MSEESIKLPATPDNNLNPKINYNDNAKICVKFYGNYSKQEKVT